MTTGERFWAKVDRRDDGCWVWTGCRVRGYGQFAVDRKPRLTHRYAYELLVGPIPQGLTIDHLCRNRSCVNPAHMEPVTVRENNRRGTGFAGRNHRATHCIHGHEFTEENTRIRPDGDRQCRTCHRESMRRYREEARA